MYPVFTKHPLSLIQCFLHLSLVILNLVLVSGLNPERLEARTKPAARGSAKDLLQLPTPTPEALPSQVPGAIAADQFEIAGSTGLSLNPEQPRAQTIDTAQVTPTPPILFPPGIERPAPTPPPPQKPPVLPPPQDLLQPSAPTPPTPELLPSNLPGNITVERFVVVGSTVFSRKTLAAATAKFTKKPITFAELLQASAAITKLYTDKGYITSGAFIPANQTFQTQGSVVRIQVVEGSLEGIRVTGTRRLNPNYVRRRLAIATSKPLNVNRLLEALRLLQLNPLIKNISGELAAGSRPATSLLDVKVAEANTRSAQVNLNNNREPSVGSFERQIQLNEADLLGQGDGLSVAYGNTDGSDDVSANYTFPINPQNGTIQLNYGYISSHVVEPPFNNLNIRGTLQDFDLTLRQPVIQTPTQEFALGLSANRRVSDIGYLETLGQGRLGFPEPGADRKGRTRLAVVRFFQEWTQRNSQQVLAARSQFSLGIGAFDATISTNQPDSRFFVWRGQAQWVRLLAEDTLFLVRADAQLASRPLVPIEQIGVGGQQTVRGYRQDLLLTDNAFLTSAELRLPILRVPEVRGVLQLAPFVDFGTASNNSSGSSGRNALNPNAIASVGLGLQWQQSNRLTARFDWGIPLVSVSGRKRTLQEKGLYFSVVYTLLSF